MSKNKNISTPQVADPRDVKVGLISALFSILVLMILLFFITYEIANPLPKDEVVNAETIVGEILLEDLKIESGSIGGGWVLRSAKGHTSDRNRGTTIR